MKQTSYPSLPLLIVDDEPEALEMVKAVLENNGINNIILCQEPGKVMNILAKKRICLILMDLKMPGVSGEELLSMTNQKHPDTPVIILTATSEMETAIRCVKNNAYDYLVKPIDESLLIPCIKRCISFREVSIENQSLKKSILSEEFESPEMFDRIITRNPKMIAVYKYAEAIAGTNAHLLITGEYGAGKQFIAQTIHALSGRKGKFVCIKPSELDQEQFNAAIFGQAAKPENAKKLKIKKGWLMTAQGGTLYFDGIEDIAIENQKALCELIQTGKFTIPATNNSKILDTRLVFATAKDPVSLIESESLRYDLYHRLCANLIDIPPLRQRTDDLPLLIDHFFEKASEAEGVKTPKYPRELSLLLSSHPFRNNISELKKMIREAVAKTKSGTLKIDAFDDYLVQNQKLTENIAADMLSEEKADIASWKKLPPLKDIERLMALEAMKRTNGNRSVAARILGITRQTLVKYLPKEDEAY